MFCNMLVLLLVLLLVAVLVGGVVVWRTRRSRDAIIVAVLARRKAAQLQALGALALQIAPAPITDDHLTLLFDATTEELERWADDAEDTLYLRPTEAGDGDRRGGDGAPNDGGEAG